MKKVLIGVGVVVLLVIAAVGIFFATFDINSYRGRIQSELQQQLGRQVTLGNMDLSIFPLEAKVQNISIADDPKFGTAPFVQAKELDVALQLMPLLHKDVEVDSITLQRPAVEMIKDKSGVWNFSTIGSNKPASGKSSSSQQFSLSKLSVQDGQVALTDKQAPSPRAVYDHIDLTLEDFAPNKPFSVDLAAHLPGGGTQEVRLKGKGGPIANEPANTPFAGTLNLKDVKLGGLQQFLNSPALAGTDGTLNGETKINTSAGQASASGNMKVTDPKFKGNALGYPIDATYDVADNLTNDLITIKDTTIKLGSTPFVIAGTANTKPTPAQIDMGIKANNVAVGELIQLAAATGQAFAPGMKLAGNVSADIHAKGAADKPALSGSVNGRNIAASGAGIAQEVTVPQLDLALTPTDVRSNNFNIVSGGTTANVQFTLKNYTQEVPAIDFSMKAANAQLPAILSIARAYGVTSLNNLTGQGTLNLDARASGPVRKMTQAEIAKLLNGNVKVAFNNVRYSGVDIDHEFAKIGGLGQASQADKGYTDISKVTGDIAIKSGVALTNNLQALLNLGNIGVTGTANLADESLNMRVTAVLTKQAAQAAGGTGVGGYMTTALANNQGELVIPAIVTGTFQHPKYAPDMQKMAQMKLKGLIPSFDNPQQGAAGVLGGLLGQGGQKGAAGKQQQQQQQNPAQQLLGIFGKKK